MELAAAGIDSFAHLVRDREMSDALVAMVRKNGVYVMPNISSPERNTHASPPPWLDEPYLAGLLRDTVAADVIERMRGVFARRDPAAADGARKTYANLQRSVAKLSAAGANVILGCDTGLEDHFFGYAEQKELELMVDAGMTPMQVIVAATSRGGGLSPPGGPGHARAPASAPISWCSMATRSTTSATHAGSHRCISAAPKWIARRSRRR